MTVIDLRDDMYKRRIDVIEIDDGVIYYAEELNSRGSDSVCVCMDTALMKVQNS